MAPQQTKCIGLLNYARAINKALSDEGQARHVQYSCMGSATSLNIRDQVDLHDTRKAQRRAPEGELLRAMCLGSSVFESSLSTTAETTAEDGKGNGLDRVGELRFVCRGVELTFWESLSASMVPSIPATSPLTPGAVQSTNMRGVVGAENSNGVATAGLRMFEELKAELIERANGKDPLWFARAWWSTAKRNVVQMKTFMRDLSGYGSNED